MSYYQRKYSPYKYNPQLEHDAHYVKMQNLLDQYDRENQFLGKQVTDLLHINKMLQAKNYVGQAQKADYNQQRKSRNYQNTNENSVRRKKYSYIDQIDSKYASEPRHKAANHAKTNKDNRQKQVQKLRQKLQLNASQNNKKNSFSRDPYIQTSDIKNFREVVENREGDAEDKDSPLKKSTNKNSGILTTTKGKNKRQSPGKKQKFGLQLIEKSLSKEKERSLTMNKSGISLKSNNSSKSKKSGIVVVSREVSPDNKKDESPGKIQLPMSAQKIIKQGQSGLFITPTKIPEVKKETAEDKHSPVIPKRNPEKQIVFEQTKTQPNLSLQRAHSLSFISQKSKEIEKPVYKNDKFKKSESLADISQRSHNQSRHRILPSTNIFGSKASNQSLIQKKQSYERRPSIDGKQKRKFITIVSKALVEKGIDLKKDKIK